MTFFRQSGSCKKTRNYGPGSGIIKVIETIDLRDSDEDDSDIEIISSNIPTSSSTPPPPQALLSEKDLDSMELNQLKIKQELLLEALNYENENLASNFVPIKEDKESEIQNTNETRSGMVMESFLENREAMKLAETSPLVSSTTKSLSPVPTQFQSDDLPLPVPMILKVEENYQGGQFSPAYDKVSESVRQSPLNDFAQQNEIIDPNATMDEHLLLVPLEQRRCSTTPSIENGEIIEDVSHGQTNGTTKNQEKSPYSPISTDDENETDDADRQSPRPNKAFDNHDLDVHSDDSNDTVIMPLDAKPNIQELQAESKNTMQDKINESNESSSISQQKPATVPEETSKACTPLPSPDSQSEPTNNTQTQTPETTTSITKKLKAMSDWQKSLQQPLKISKQQKLFAKSQKMFRNLQQGMQNSKSALYELENRVSNSKERKQIPSPRYIELGEKSPTPTTSQKEKNPFDVAVKSYNASTGVPKCLNGLNQSETLLSKRQKLDTTSSFKKVALSVATSRPNIVPNESFKVCSPLQSPDSQFQPTNNSQTQNNEATSFSVMKPTNSREDNATIDDIRLPQIAAIKNPLKRNSDALRESSPPLKVKKTDELKIRIIRTQLPSPPRYTSGETRKSRRLESPSPSPPPPPRNHQNVNGTSSYFISTPPQTACSNESIPSGYEKGDTTRSVGSSAEVLQPTNMNTGFPRNVDILSYAEHPSTKICRICKESEKRIVDHYVRKHKSAEIYCSRLEPATANKLRYDLLSEPSYENEIYKAFCVFCLIDHSKTFGQWITHYSKFTGEYLFYCIICHLNQRKENDCVHAMEHRKFDEMSKNDITAYMCNLCNYIQLENANVIKHLRREHEEIGVTRDISNKYQKVILLAKKKHSNSDKSPENTLPEHEAPQCDGNLQKFGNICPSIDTPGPSHQGSNTQTSVSEKKRVDEGKRVEVLENVQVSPPKNVAIPQQKLSPTIQPQNIAKGEAYDQELIKCAKYYMLSPIGLTWANVKPWIKNDVNAQPEEANWSTKQRLHIQTQYALFKCMHPSCIFATNDGAKMRIHIESHMDLVGALSQEHELEDKNGAREKHNRCRACPYCVLYKRIDTVQHIEDNHKQSCFQCAHCYYRTIEIVNIFTHNEKYHRSTSETDYRKFLFCGDGKRDVTDEIGCKVVECFEESKSHLNLSCGLCGYTCYYLDEFFGHLSAQHPNESYICNDCGEHMEMDRVEQHLETHSMAEYQCIYCADLGSFGCRNIEQMKEHMSDSHPDEFLFVAARRTKLNKDVVDIKVSDTHLNILATYDIYKCPSDTDLNSMDPSVLAVTKNLKIPNMTSYGDKIEFSEIPKVAYSNKHTFFMSHQEYLEKRIAKKQQPDIKPDVKPIISELPNTSRLVNKPQKTSFVQEKDLYACCCCQEISKSDVQFEEHFKGSHLNDKSLDKFVCPHCDLAIERASSDENFLKDILKHFQLHSGSYFSCTICAHTEPVEMQMVIHFAKTHNADQMRIRQSFHNYEKSAEKVLTYEYVCNVCEEKVHHPKAILRHFSDKHPDRIIDAYIESSELNVRTQEIEMKKNIRFCRKYSCTNAACQNAEFYTKNEMIDHHLEQHPQQILEFKFKGPFLLMCNSDQDDLAEENKRFDQKWVYTCPEEDCATEYLTTPESFDEHREKLEHSKARFSVKKLIKCLHCSKIFTFDQIETHFVQKHPNIPVKAGDAIYKNRCASCDYGISKDRQLFEDHFRLKHPNLDSLNMITDEMLERLAETRRRTCNDRHFRHGCSRFRLFPFDPHLPIGSLKKIVAHVNECKRKFTCDQCPNELFETCREAVKHDFKKHDMSNSIEDRCNFKEFLSYFDDVEIIFENDFTVAMKYLAQTTFGQTLKLKISEEINEILKNERLLSSEDTDDYMQ